MSANEELDPREELAAIAASVRAYVEWQIDTGATGAPRGGRTRAAAQAQPEAHAPVQAAHAATVTVAPSIEQIAKPSFGQAPPMPMPAPMPAPAPTPPTVLPVSSPAAVLATSPAPATEPARGPVSLPVLAAEVASCTKCVLSTTRTHTVFARGNPEAKLVFVGEGPGAEEDASGKPFVGRAGQLLDKMIAAMGLDTERDVYICNIVKCRPPGNRNPELDEIAACMPYLHAQLDVVRPKAIVALGNTAAQSLLGTKIGITKMRGEWKLYKGTTLVMPTYHPSYLIRPSAQQLEAKRQAWDDLQAVMKELGLKKK